MKLNFTVNDGLGSHHTIECELDDKITREQEEN